MPPVLIYLLKLTLSFAAIYLFYQLVLRRLTFYNWNRWYLLGYTFLAFYIPFINIMPVLEKNAWSQSGVVNWVPQIGVQHFSQGDAAVVSDTSASPGFWAVVGIILLTGILVMMIRLLLQLISFYRMMRRAQYISGDKTRLYQVDEKIIPFSFGNSIFINRHLHTESELQEIVRHEFVHVKQMHTLDIVWGELLCLFNWYNPFAWLIRRAIRQNLEFIADNKVLENGVDRRQYQYLLLKVIGNDHFSIAQKFNFSSLKKRIAMMNKIKTARVHVIRFLFILPLLFVLLVAFRSQYHHKVPEPVIRTVALVIDKETRQPLEGVLVLNKLTAQKAVTDENGYYTMDFPANKPIDIHLLYLKKGYQSLVTQSFSLEKVDNKESFGLLEVVEIKKGDFTEGCKGCGSSVRVQTLEPGLGYKEVVIYHKYLQIAPSLKKPFHSQPVLDTVPRVTVPNNKGYIINIEDWSGTCVVVVQDKKGNEVKSVDLNKWKENAKQFEELYGEIPAVPVIAAISGQGPTVATIGNPVQIVNPSNPAQSTVTISKAFEITDKKAVMQLPGGVTETYDLTNPVEKKKFEEKFGKVIQVSPLTGVASPTVIQGGQITGVSASIAPVQVSGTMPQGSVTGAVAGMGVGIGKGQGISTGTGQTVIAPMNGVGEVMIVGSESNIINGEEDILITITRNTTWPQLEEFKKQMKAKDIELVFDDIEYDNKGQLTKISGTMKSKDGKSNFVATDFYKLILAMVRSGDKTYFKVVIRDTPEVI